MGMRLPDSVETLWEKKKLLVTSNLSFSHNVFKSCLLLMCQNEYLWSKGLKQRYKDQTERNVQFDLNYCWKVKLFMLLITRLIVQS